MAEKHDRLESRYRRKLINKKYKINKKAPFVDYRPDIYASKNKEKIFVEVEIEQTLHNDHTLSQLDKMYRYIKRRKIWHGVLVVPKKAKQEAIFLIEVVYGDDKIKVVGL
jgi:hypothetical protein